MNKQEALSKAMQLCSGKEYCCKEIAEKLTKWDVLLECHDEIIETLKEEKFIDENRFAIAYTNDKIRFNNWGRVKIKYMLRQLSISSEHIQLAFDLIQEKEYNEIISKHIQLKRKSIKQTDEYIIKSKVLSYLVGKGFEYEVVDRLYNKR